jgi:hypothetical protein
MRYFQAPSWRVSVVPADKIQRGAGILFVLAACFNITPSLEEKIQVRSASCNISCFLAKKIQLMISSCTIAGFFVKKIQVRAHPFQHSTFSFSENTILCIFLFSPRHMLQL